MKDGEGVPAVGVEERVPGSKSEEGGDPQTEASPGAAGGRQERGKACCSRIWQGLEPLLSFDTKRCQGLSQIGCPCLQSCMSAVQ